MITMSRVDDQSLDTRQSLQLVTWVQTGCLAV